ncbi:YitT family protein [Shewanella yunxiaonensis]|uniref:YitT family protein n=1 Tax=Shewanella yunxiaonensis TaxID=2829809 RepID=A0ABX7YRH1_9GAMM|nr:MULTISPECIES: YitT family protein [Shewanella]MDF0535793.1 YitT family protein [Shewanella sp. A32]QUN05364.1 YitT family protein [Shewanella yunxiaonensis]
METIQTPKQGHSLLEDISAIFIGSCFVSLGVFFLRQAGLLTGGTAGLSLLLTHLSPLTFGQWFVLLNVPFFWLAWSRMGKAFTIKTFVSIVVVSVMSDHMEMVLGFSKVNVFYSSVIGGLLLGAGMLIMFRHKSSLGGFNILALYLQDKFNIRAGKFQMVLDSSIVIASFFIISPWLLALSVFGAVVTNFVLAVNHKPGRYSGL